MDDTTNQNGFNRYRKVVNLLRKKLPAAFEVDIRRKKLKGFDGLCIREENRFLILINKDLSESMAVEALLHEYAHALSWTLLQDKLEGEAFHNYCHNASWGVAYAEVYRCYEASIPRRPYIQENNDDSSDK